MTFADSWRAPQDLLGQHSGKPLRQVECAMGVFLGRTAVELAGIQLVQLPLHSQCLLAHIPRLESDQFRPAKPCISESDGSYEFIVSPREQGAALCHLQDAQGSSDGLFGASIA